MLLPSWSAKADHPRPTRAIDACPEATRCLYVMPEPDPGIQRSVRATRSWRWIAASSAAMTSLPPMKRNTGDARVRGLAGEGRIEKPIALWLANLDRGPRRGILDERSVERHQRHAMSRCADAERTSEVHPLLNQSSASATRDAS